MPATGTYIYGLLRAREAKDLGPIGLPTAAGPAPVRALCAGEAAALVSACDEGDPLPLRRNLEPHHQVLQRAIADMTVIPMTFGHVARSEARVGAMLRHHEREIVAEIDRLQGTLEMGLRVQWQVDNVFQYLVDGDPELSLLRSRLFAPGGAAAIPDKIELGRLFERRRDEKRQRLAERLVAGLSSFAVDVDNASMLADATVADLAFLVERDQVGPFIESARALAAGWPDEYVFQCTGPWPPFHFVDLQLASGRAHRGDA